MRHRREVRRHREESSASGIEVVNGDVEGLYSDWDTPTAIVSDGAYGVGSFANDPREPDRLNEWYEPHVEAWTEAAGLETTLWVWNTEIGWANIHPVLEEYGWEYCGANTWNKGISHIAGNSNTQTLRKFPQVTEVCVQYVREEEEILPEEFNNLRIWLREEWKRSGLTFDEANDACGVEDAASRKYFTADEAWYFPPPERFKQLVEYANEYGDPTGSPYFEFAEDAPVTREEFTELSRESVREHQAVFDCPVGVTNVWNHTQVRGDERLQQDGNGATHPNQKPLELVRRIIEVSTTPDDLVWEPFGGLATTAVACKQLGRGCRVAEVDEVYYEMAVERLEKTTPRSPESRGEQADLDIWM